MPTKYMVEADARQSISHRVILDSQLNLGGVMLDTFFFILECWDFADKLIFNAKAYLDG